MIVDLRDFYQTPNNNEESDGEEHKNYYEQNNYNNPKSKNKGGKSYKTVFVAKEEIFLETVKLAKYKSLRNMYRKINSKCYYNLDHQNILKKKLLTFFEIRKK